MPRCRSPIHVISNVVKLYLYFAGEFCNILKIQIYDNKSDDSILFNEFDAPKTTIIDTFGQYEYQLLYGDKPAYKLNSTKELYLYWNPKFSEWMVIHQT